MSDNRQTRTATSREAEIRKTPWRPAHDLPAPDPRDGYVFRWVRSKFHGQSDPQNMAAARREGWVPCRPEDVPEMQADFAAFGLEGSGVIEIGGLVLCKNTVENKRGETEYYNNLTRGANDRVDSEFLSIGDDRIKPFSEKSSKVTFGRGS